MRRIRARGRTIQMVMQGQKNRTACTAYLVAGTLAPFGGLVFRPLALVGAIMVLFGIVIAAATVDH